MAKSQILVTDSLFVTSEYEQSIRTAGYDCVRLDKPKASEHELIDAIRGKIGYILGGIEEVTAPVIEAADKLQAMVFTGSGYREFIPAHSLATKKGIAIANAPGGNAAAVAEYTITLMLMMVRHALELGRTGQSKFKTTQSLRDQSVGIIGLGHVGIVLSTMLRGLGVGELYYYSRSRKYHLESGFGIKYLSLEDLLTTCDVITLHASKEAGEGFLGPQELSSIRDGGVLINAAYPDAIDFIALRNHLTSNRLRVAYDGPPSADYSDLSPQVFFCSNAQTAFNTYEAIDTVSAMAVRSLLNLLSSGDDLFLINPDYRSFRNDSRHQL